MTPTDRKRLEEIKARVAKATEGPWESREDGDYYQGGTYIGAKPYRYTSAVERKQGLPTQVPCKADDRDAYFEKDVCRVESDADFEFLLNVRTDVPWLVAEVERLSARVEELERDIDAVDYLAGRKA